eukprot:10627677-Lingulodinium_polyedra.AAC.1
MQSPGQSHHGRSHVQHQNACRRPGAKPPWPLNGRKPEAKPPWPLKHATPGSSGQHAPRKARGKAT